MATKNPWAISSSVEETTANVSLQDVMSEQMALNLQQEETTQVSTRTNDDHELNHLLNSALDQQSHPDFILAKLLQLEFDQEFEDYSKNKDAGNESLTIDRKSLLKENRLQAAAAKKLEDDQVHGKKEEEEKKEENDDDNGDDDDDYDDDDDDYDGDDDDREWDMFVKTEKIPSLGKVGYVIEDDGNIRTKHDPNHSSRMNACRAMNFSNISTGDGGSFDMKLNNNVYNSLKTHVRKERRRTARVNEKCEKSTAEGVMDEQSRLQIFKLVNMGIIDQCNGVVSTGKESNVYHGMGCNLEKKINMGEVAIKVFKTTLTEFKNRSSYIRGDYRFKDRLAKQNSRKMINLWAEKEMHNLSRIKRGGILCPDVVMLKKHILVMSFLGKNGSPSPTLREAIHLNDVQLSSLMNETIEIMKKLYWKCDLVHGDLSEYNIIYHMGHAYVIDVGQSVLRGHPNALRFLLRDCNNVSRFFNSRGMTEMLTGPELFCEITGHKIEITDNLDEVDILKKIFALEKDNQMLSKNPTDDQADDLFEQMLLKSELDKKKAAAAN